MSLFDWARLPGRLAKRAAYLPAEILALQRDAVAMQVLAPLNVRFQPFTGYSMRPAGILALVNEVIINRRRSVVECGPGLSTFYLARVLKPLGGRLISIDHNAEWLEVLAEQLRAESLDETVTLVHAPLTPGDWGMGMQEWYNPDAIRAQIPNRCIDMLVVDGPVASSRELQYARFPAVPYFRDCLSTNATILLDDIGRNGEQEILRRWSQILAASFERRQYAGRIAIARIGVGLAI